MATFQLTSNRRLTNDKEFTIEPLTIESYSLLSAACTNDDHESFMRAMVDSTNYTDQELSLSDVLQIAVYHRINEYPEAPLALNWKCQGSLVLDSSGNSYTHRQFEDIHDVEDFQIVDCGQTNVQTFNMENFPFNYMGIANLDDDLSIPTASLYAEYIEYSKDPKLAMLIPAFCWIKTEVNTIAEKIKRVEEEGPELYKKAQKASYKLQHGPCQKLRADCPNCDTNVSKVIAVNQHSFFR